MSDPVVSAAAMAGNLGEPLVATINGQRYKFKLIDQLVKAELEQIVAGRARAAVLREAGVVDENVFRAMYSAFLNNESAGAYRFGGTQFMAFLQQFDGIRMLAVALCPALDEVWEKLFENEGTAEQVMAVVNEVMTKSFPAASGKKKLATK